MPVQLKHVIIRCGDMSLPTPHQVASEVPDNTRTVIMVDKDNSTGKVLAVSMWYQGSTDEWVTCLSNQRYKHHDKYNPFAECVWIECPYLVLN